MTVKWKKDFAIEKFVTRLDAAKVTDPPGSFGFEASEYEECYSVLNNLIECHNEIPAEEKRIIVGKALMAAGFKGQITADSIIKELQSLEVEFLKRPLNQYILCTSMSVSCSTKLKTTKMHGATIQFKKKLPIKFAIHAHRHYRIAELNLTAKPPTDYLSVMITISGRSPLDAAGRAFEVIDLIRGLWNYEINRRQYSRNSYGNREPVNKIILGPLHTLHNLTGELATEMWWYDPDYQKAQEPSNLKENLEDMFKTEKIARKFFKTHNYRTKLEWGIKEYCRALDHRNWSTSFLKLWSVLEALTNSDTYSTTIKRAAFVWHEPEYHREVLNNLRHMRNSFVHENKSTDDIEAYIYQLKRYVEALIKFHFNRGRQFATIAQATEFMDLPTDPDILKGKIEVYERALKYMA